MTTVQKFYLHDVVTTVTGTLPGATSLSGVTPNNSANGASANRSMDGSIGAIQAPASLTTTASTSAQSNWFRSFISPPLEAQTIGAGTWTLQAGMLESNNSSNFLVFFRVYVWRPSTGATVGTILSASSNSAEPSTTETNESTTGTGSAVTCNAGDVIVVEVWGSNTQAMSTSYTNTIDYDGTTEASTTSNAAFLNAPAAITLALDPITPASNISATSTMSGSIAKGIIPTNNGPTTPVLDDFNRADGALGSDWAGPFGSPTVAAAIVGNQATAGSAGEATAGYTRTDGLLGTNGEAYFEVPTLPVAGNNVRVSMVASPTSATTNAYYFRVNPSTLSWFLTRVDGWSTFATMASGSISSFSAGDALWLQRINNVLYGYARLGGTWTLIGQATDFNYDTNGWSPGFDIDDTTTRLDNFGGGAIVATQKNVSATSTISGSMTKASTGPKAITPTQINATSTTSGAVVKLTLIKPTTSVAATSTVTGSVSKLAHVTPSSNIAATSTVSITKISALRRIGPTQVSATSTVAGNAVALRKIAPTQVAATSTVTGLVSALRKITPAQISATSTTTGSVAKLWKIVPAQISATSSATGKVVALRTISPTQIAATSTATGTIGRSRLIVPTTISATSTVTGAIGRVRRITPTQISSTSTVSGTVVALRRVTPTQISATSTIGGTITALRKIAGAISATSTVSGSIVALRAIKPTQISATSTITGSVTRQAHVTPTQISAISTVTGALGARRKITTAQISATSTVSGVVSKHGTDPIITTQISATSTVSGKVITLHRVSGNVSATSTVAGQVIVLHRIQGAISASSTVTGSIRRLRPITPTQVSATSTVAGKIIVLHRITPTTQITATSTVSGSVTRTGQAVITPNAPISATSLVSGHVSALHLLHPTIVSATSSVTGTADVLRAIRPSQISAFSILSGAASVERPIGGFIDAQSAVTGSLPALRPIDPSVIAATSVVNGLVHIDYIPVSPVLATSVVTGDLALKRSTFTGSASLTGIGSLLARSYRRHFHYQNKTGKANLQGEGMMLVHVTPSNTNDLGTVVGVALVSGEDRLFTNSP